MSISSPEKNYNIMELDVLNSYIYSGKYASEIHLRFPMSTIKLRFYNNEELANLFEIESIIDPNFIRNEYEFMLLLDTNIKNSVVMNNTSLTEFWTDSNGMKMLRRVQDHRFGWDLIKDEDFSSNFYPFNSFFSIRNNSNRIRDMNESSSNYSILDENDAILTVFNDRSQGGSSYKEGEILIDLMRYSTTDDRRGLSNGIFENSSQFNYFHVNHWVLFNSHDKEAISDIIQKIPLIASFSIDLNEEHNSMTKSKYLLIKSYQCD